MISEAKLAANRRNSLKGGVKTREGKLKSRRNALKHGYRAEEVLPEDLQAEADERFHQLVDEIRPEGTIETGLARRMALELTKLERLETEEHAALAARIREAGKAFDDLQRRRVEACAKLLPQQPARAVRGLLGFTAGCNWLLAEWADLRGKLASGAWGDEESRRAWHLLGGPAVEAGGAKVAACLAEEVAAIEAERDALWEELDGPLRQEAEDRALLDTSPEGQIRHRHEGQSVRQLHKAIDQYCKGRQGWFEPKRGGRRRPAPNEPTAEVVKETILAAGMPVVDAARGAVTADPHPGPLPGGSGGRSDPLAPCETAGVQAHSDPAAPNEPTAEVVMTTTVPSATLPSGAGQADGLPHGEPLVAPAPPAPAAAGPASNPQHQAVSQTMPSVSPNEPTAEVHPPQGLPPQYPGFESTIRREAFAAPARPVMPLVSDGIRVR
ncbi:MAG TPA: hypothetical protein VG406_12060 [Isosphaeraceae bacterium]|nr:hypothetical protein [Isosphaeraceae bacterium]